MWSVLIKHNPVYSYVIINKFILRNAIEVGDRSVV